MSVLWSVPFHPMTNKLMSSNQHKTLKNIPWFAHRLFWFFCSSVQSDARATLSAESDGPADIELHRQRMTYNTRCLWQDKGQPKHCLGDIYSSRRANWVHLDQVTPDQLLGGAVWSEFVRYCVTLCRLVRGSLTLNHSVLLISQLYPKLTYMAREEGDYCICREC